MDGKYSLPENTCLHIVSPFGSHPTAREAMRSSAIPVGCLSEHACLASSYRNAGGEVREEGASRGPLWALRGPQEDRLGGVTVAKL